MRVRSAKQNKINIVTLGCSKNLVDSEVLLSQLKSNQMDVEHESTSNDAAIVIVNTCGFIDRAKEESIQTILRYAEEKKEGNIEKLLVTGCLSERYKEDLRLEIPEVDAWFGTMELPSLLQTLEADYKHELVGERLTTTPFHYAYLKISEGCDRPCSFCAIPLMRGKHVSKSIESLVQETKNLVSNGLKELILIAQDSTYYGLDLYGERKLADLLKALAEVEGVEWIRLHYAYPSQFPMDVLDVMAEKDNICKYLDIPIQHIADPVLKSMRRGITKRRTIELLQQIRESVPGIAIRTTVLVGHPGETPEAFQELCDFIREFKFDRLGVFTYSHEENTHAYTLADEITQEEKERRAALVMEIQSEIAEEANQKKVGSIQKVLIDRKEGDYFVGRTTADSPDVDNEVLIAAQSTFLRQGDFVLVEITESAAYDLIGVPVNSKA
jgi:ribosomal protein S12 methylthiotransferase